MEISPLIPTEGRMVVTPVEKTIADGKLVLSENAKDTPQVGKVIAISDIGDVSEHDSNVIFESPAKVGDKVLYANWSGANYEANGKKYSVIRFRDVVAVIK